MRRLLPLLLALCSALPLAADDTAPTVGPLTQDVFSSEITRGLVNHFNLEGELQIELLRTWNPPQVVARDWQVVITEYPSVAASAMLLRCRVLADGQPAAESTLTLRASLWKDVWIARQPLVHGAVFDPALLETRRAPRRRRRPELHLRPRRQRRSHRHLARHHPPPARQEGRHGRGQRRRGHALHHHEGPRAPERRPR